MTVSWQTKASFLYGSTDMYVTYGIKLANDSIPEDVLLPELRPRKVTVPLRSGAYDYGALFYNERTIQIECVTTRALTRDDTREIAYTLSKKAEIRFWTEPDKFYIGRVYQPPSLELLRNAGSRFQMAFICEPFAYGRTLTEQFTGQAYIPDYSGTAPTPTYIVIKNTGTSNAVNIKITQTDKRG